MNLYAIKVHVCVGRKNSTHFEQTPTFHVSASSIGVAVGRVYAKADRWARKEYSHFVANDTPIIVDVLMASLLDEDWE